MGYLVLKSGAYYVVFSLVGKKLWKKIGKLYKKDARQILKKLELEFERERLNLMEIKQIALFDYIDKYLPYAQALLIGVESYLLLIPISSF
jgi:hypothetical protein